jgi:hypothetical protein
MQLPMEIPDQVKKGLAVARRKCNAQPKTRQAVRNGQASGRVTA